MKIKDAIISLADSEPTGWDTLVSDGATNWTLANLLDEVVMNDDTRDWTVTGMGLVPLDEHGYQTGVNNGYALLRPQFEVPADFNAPLKIVEDK